MEIRYRNTRKQEYNRIVEFMRIYQENGRENALRYLNTNKKNYHPLGVGIWFHIPTKNIPKYRKI